MTGGVQRGVEKRVDSIFAVWVVRHLPQDERDDSPADEGERLKPQRHLVLGASISIPLFVILSRITIRFGTGWAILFAAVGDVAAAALLGVIEPRTGVELAIITVFVYIGIRLAPVISGLIFR